MTRTFEAKPAVREAVPLLVGLFGPSGSGKTYSALRLATGIQKIVGGDIHGIDTEARRMLNYADFFKFRHVQFDAPFGSLDYLAAVEQSVKQGAKTIIVDSMSHEHIGPGGYLLTHEAEVDRMAGGDGGKRERVKMAGWIKPASLRSQMINGILQLNANFIFCFRAKEKTKPKSGGGVIELGYMPLAGEEWLFEMTVNLLLLPKSGGVPTWDPENVGERAMIKPAEQFRDIFETKQPLSESIGEKLATWAKGGTTSAASTTPSRAADQRGEVTASPPGLAPDLLAAATDAAKNGTAAYKTFWANCEPFEQKALHGDHERLKTMATEADMQGAMA